MLSFDQSLSGDDLGAVLQLYCDAFNAPDKGESWTVDGALAYFEARSDDTSVYGLLRDESRSIQAFIFGGKSYDDESGETFYLSQFVVGEAFRGQGWGGQILSGYLGHIKQLGYRRAIVRCRANNQAMCSMLPQYGFEIFKRYDDTFGGVTCARLMFKKDF